LFELNTLKTPIDFRKYLPWLHFTP
jgi:hypothetical protein